MIEITKEWTFDAAHQLMNHDGKCARLHGHTYRVQVTVAGEVNRTTGEPDEGMLVDFAVLSGIWKESLEPLLDHQDLNQTIGAECWPTTAENIAAWIADTFDDRLAAGDKEDVQVVRVDVWETPTGKATWRP